MYGRISALYGDKMAELLVRAKPHWMDDLKPGEVNKLSPQDLQSYNARTQIGDIIVVRPDGWEWGREECLPNFIVVKLPTISIDTVKKYEETLMNADHIMLKRRKHRIPQSWVENYKTLNQSVVTINLTAQQTALISSVIEKTS